jgi:hypothetical protein
MKILLFFTFLLSLCTGGVLIGLGILLRNHFETIISLIVRKPFPDDLIIPDDYAKTKTTIRWIGSLVILLGIAKMIISLSTLMAGYWMTNISVKSDLFQ